MPNYEIETTTEMTTKDIIKKINRAIKNTKFDDEEDIYNYYDTIACYELQIIYHHYDIENTHNNKLLKTVNKINWLRNKINNNENIKIIYEGSHLVKPLEPCSITGQAFNHPSFYFEFEEQKGNIFDYLNWTEYHILKKQLNHKRTSISKKQDILKRLNELEEQGYILNEEVEESDDEDEKVKELREQINENKKKILELKQENKKLLEPNEEEELDIVLFVPKHKRK